MSESEQPINGTAELGAFFAAHHCCDPAGYIVQKRRIADRWRVDAFCPVCAGSVIADLSDAEHATITAQRRRKSAPKPQPPAAVMLTARERLAALVGPAIDRLRELVESGDLSEREAHDARMLLERLAAIEPQAL
jgi:hypothetical protein